jgi:hypothetical protein
MAHFAKISEENEVLAVLRVNDEDAPNESAGQAYLEQHNNWPAHLWIQTSYNTQNGVHKNGGTPFRGNYASTGYIWDPDNQIFWPKKPYASWVKNMTTFEWESPIGNAPTLTTEQESQNDALTHLWSYEWNEDNQTWNLTNLLV